MATANAVQVPAPFSAGPEMAALGHFLPDVTWEGTVVEGGMGPGTPDAARREYEFKATGLGAQA